MLAIQNELYSAVQSVSLHLTELAKFIHEAEETDVAGTAPKSKNDNGRGFSLEEKRLILEKFNVVHAKCTENLLPKFKRWVEARREDPNLLTIDREEKISADAARREKAFSRRLEHLKQVFEAPSEADEWRLDTLSEEFRDWISSGFARAAQEWELPSVEMDFGDYTFNYKLTFFVDDIQAERFGRLGRVLSDMKERIAARLLEEGINMPDPVRAVHMDGSINLVQTK